MARLDRHRENVIEILRELHEAGERDMTDDFSRGWGEAINTATRIVERITRIIVDDAVWQMEQEGANWQKPERKQK